MWLSNVVLETIDYLVRLFYPTVLEHVTLNTLHHSIQKGFAKDYAVLSIDQQ
jgi:truncated hemoglobin YjbI